MDGSISQMPTATVRPLDLSANLPNGLQSTKVAIQIFLSTSIFTTTVLEAPIHLGYRIISPPGNRQR